MVSGAARASRSVMRATVRITSWDLLSAEFWTVRGMLIYHLLHLSKYYLLFIRRINRLDFHRLRERYLELCRIKYNLHEL
jgi:hypothetical protein